MIRVVLKNPNFFACPLSREFRDLGKFAKITRREYSVFISSTVFLEGTMFDRIVRYATHSQLECHVPVCRRGRDMQKSSPRKPRALRHLPRGLHHWLSDRQTNTIHTTKLSG